MKLLDNTTFEMAFKEIPANDLKFLELIVEYLHKNKQLFVSCVGSNIDDEDN